MFQPQALPAAVPAADLLDLHAPAVSRRWTVRYSVLAFVWLCGFAIAAAVLPDLNELGFLLASMLLATPVALRLAYGRSLARIDTLRKVESSSILRGLLSGGLLRMLFSLLASTVFTGWLLLQIATDPGLLAWLAIVAFLVPVMKARAEHVLGGHVHSLWLPSATSRAGAWIAAATVMIGCMAWTWLMPPEVAFTSLVEARAAMPVSASDSALMQTLFLWSGAATALRDYGLSLAVAASPSLVTWLALTTILLFPTLLAIALGLSLFLLPARELSRALLPAREEVPQSREAIRGVVIALLLACSVGFVAAQGASQLERQAMQMGWPDATRRALNTVEQIDGHFYPYGTISLLASQEAEARARVARADLLAEAAVRRSFEAMRGNVDSYLDWHYSLAGDLTRLGGLVSRRLAERATERLMGGEAAQALEEALAEAIEARLQAEQASDAALAFLAQRRLQIDNPAIVHVGASSALAELAPTLVSPPDPIAFEERIAAGIGTGIAAAVVVRGAVIRRAGRAVGARVGGTAAGAALGSVVPGLGTAAGAVAGLMTGLAVDWLALNLNEAVGREEFRAKLMEEIDTREQAALALLSEG